MESALDDEKRGNIPLQVYNAIERRCLSILSMLQSKNKAYGNSATNPVRIFSRCSTDEQLRVRIDDKLSRLAKGDPAAFGEDVVEDLIGYLILLLVHKDLQASPIADKDQVLEKINHQAQ